MLFQVCLGVRRQQIVIKSNLVLKDDLDTWLRQKKTGKVSPYNVIVDGVLDYLPASGHLIKLNMDRMLN